MVSVNSVDLSGLNEFIHGLRGALFGTGQGGDIHRLLKTEAGQLAWEIAENLGPSSKADAGRNIDKNVQTFLSPKPRYSNLTEAQQFSTWSDFTWLAAGPNFLLGINDEDNRRDASVDEALKIMRAGQKAGSRGKAYVDLGKRGTKGRRQHIMRLNRTRVTAQTFNQVRAAIKARIGQMKASFAATAAKLIPEKRIPGWIRQQIAKVETNGKTVFDDAGLNHPTTPFIRFGSRAIGVENNPVIAIKVQGAAVRRSKVLAEKVRQVLAGYTYDWNTGKTFRQRSLAE